MRTEKSTIDFFFPDFLLGKARDIGKIDCLDRVIRYKDAIFWC